MENTPTPLHPVATTQAGELSFYGSLITSQINDESITLAHAEVSELLDYFDRDRVVPEGYALALIDRSYDQRVKAIIAFNQCPHDLDDKLNSAYIAALAETPKPAIEMQASHSAAADADGLCAKDINVMRKWASQIERAASIFSDERALLCQQAAILIYRITAHPSPTTAPAATTPAASESIRSREFYELMQTYRHMPAVKLVETVDAYEAVIAHINAHTAAQVAASKPADELHFNAQRLRNVARLVGLPLGALPDDDATCDGARGAVLGMIATHLRCKPAGLVACPRGCLGPEQGGSGCEAVYGECAMDKPAAASGDPLPLMRAAFVTSESDGAGRYSLRFRFQTMGDMHIASDQWFKYCKIATPPAQAPALPATPDQRNIVTGKMRCAKCDFSVLRTVLNVANGNIGAGDNKTEPCPNGCGPLWPITWEQEAKECYQLCEQLFDRAKVAEDALAALPATGEALTDEQITKLYTKATGSSLRSHEEHMAFGFARVIESAIIAALKDGAA